MLGRHSAVQCMLCVQLSCGGRGSCAGKHSCTHVVLQALSLDAGPLQAFEGGRAGLLERLFPSLESVSAIMTGEAYVAL